MKVLHIVENLNRGAVENWLVRMLRHSVAHGAPLDWTFYCVVGERGERDDEVRQLGARIEYSPVPLRNNIAFLRALRRELRWGSYDVVHCHHDLTSAVYLLASIGLPIRKRIVHVHNADEGVPTPNWLKAFFARPLLRGICLATADNIVGISNHTLDIFLAGRKRRPNRDAVLYYGVDSLPFKAAAGNRLAFRRHLGLADDARILLFAGRIVPEKNPLFAIEVLAELRKRDPRTAGIFVGSGSLDDAVCRRVAEMDLAPAFRHLGWRNDIAEIMCCCDWFILPRPEQPMEGFGLAVVEAQLAGLRLLLSRGIADDPLLPTASCARLALADGPSAWADAALCLLRQNPPQRADAFGAAEKSPFALGKALENLVHLHQ